MRRVVDGLVVYAGPISTGVVLWAWALHVPYAERLLAARLCVTD